MGFSPGTPSACCANPERLGLAQDSHGTEWLNQDGRTHWEGLSLTRDGRRGCASRRGTGSQIAGPRGDAVRGFRLRRGEGVEVSACGISAVGELNDAPRGKKGLRRAGR